MFFFLPLSIGLLDAINFFIRRKVVFFVMVAAVTLLLIVLGVSVFMQNNIYKDEKTLWTDNARKAPNLHAPHQNLGNIYLRTGNLPEAFDEFQHALHSEFYGHTQSKYDTYKALIYYYILIKDYDKADHYLNEILKNNPRSAAFYNIKGVILFAKNEISQAKAMIQKAISINPDDAQFHSNLSMILLKEGQFGEAAKEAKNALKLNPDSWKSYFVIGNVYKMKGNQEVANHFDRIGQRMKSEIQSNPLREDPLVKWELN